jgi:hypothetical protein
MSSTEQPNDKYLFPIQKVVTQTTNSLCKNYGASMKGLLTLQPEFTNCEQYDLLYGIFWRKL